jgi:hypothetical protein
MLGNKPTPEIGHAPERTPEMASVLDLPDADVVYANYCETCRRLGVEPVPRERS